MSDGHRRPRLKSRMRVAVRAVEERAAESTRRRDRVGFYLLRIGTQLVRQWARDRCPQQAASLAFQTILSVVPVLAVMLAAIRATGLVDAESSLVNYLSRELLPVSREEIALRLTSWSENVTFESLGLIGLVSTVLIAFVMFNSVERIMNYIWRVEKRRALTQKFVVFYASATLGPLLLGASLYHATRFGLTEGWTGALISMGLTFVALFLANYFIPAIRVQVVPAAIGALVTTFASEIAKLAFAAFVSEYAFGRYAGIYGAVAILPLLLIWIYWAWLMFLFGAEVAHAAQNFRVLERMDRRGAMPLETELLRRVTGATATRMMVAVSETYSRGGQLLSRRALADRFDLSTDAVERLLNRLQEIGLVLELSGERRGLVPGRPPADITVAEILRAFRADERPEGPGEGTPVDLLLSDIERSADRHSESITLADLLGDPTVEPTPHG